jgi:CelD/BcsL family acetyltransferase involved in cellulose biosynthesis
VHYVFQTREWLENWFEHVGRRRAVRPCLVSVFDDAGNPAVFFPFQIAGGGFVRELNWLGDDLIDYGAPVLGSGTVDGFPALWAEILSRLPEVDLIKLSKIPETIDGADNPMTRLNCRRYHSSAHHVELDGDWDEFYERHAGAKTRSTDRRKHRKLAEMGKLEFSATDGGDESIFAEITGRMIEQKAERYREMRAPNIMARDGVGDFFARPKNDLPESGMLHVSALELDGDVITTHWGMRHGTRYYYYMPSYADGPWMRCSPGRLQLFELFKWCLDNGVTVFDFTIGDESYKQDWCDRELRLLHYFEARTFRGGVASAAHRIRAALLSNRFVLSVARWARKLFH